MISRPRARMVALCPRHTVTKHLSLYCLLIFSYNHNLCCTTHDATYLACLSLITVRSTDEQCRSLSQVHIMTSFVPSVLSSTEHAIS